MNISYRPDSTWQVPTLCFLFLLLGVGNIITISWTVPAKIRETKLGMLKIRFTRLDKYFWSHSRRPQSISKVCTLVQIGIILLIIAIPE